jgi:hypothetical protein
MGGTTTSDDAGDENAVAAKAGANGDEATSDTAPAGKQAAEHRALFNRDDAKLLLITFGGTVAANLVTVMIVAVAVILTRSMNSPITPTEADVIIAVTLVGVAWLMAYAVVPKGSTLGRMVRRAFFRIAVPFAALVGITGLIVMLGEAAGVK